MKGLMQNPINCILRIKSNKPKTTWPLSCLIIHYDCIYHVSIILKVLSKTFFCYSGRQPPNKYFFGSQTSGSRSITSIRLVLSEGILLFPRKCSLSFHHSAINSVFVLKNSVERRRVGENDEAKASWTSSRLVAHNNSLGNLAVLAEVIPELLFCSVPRYPSYEQFALV
uniref:Uncharacterized protein n=1 Tax=Opuntia streptacantha TaxID=393608 RepID=A0A7C9D5P2_OPUST